MVYNYRYIVKISEYTAFWDKHDNDNKATISHADYDKFLSKYVKSKNGITYIDYGNVVVSDKSTLKGYIRRLEKMQFYHIQRMSKNLLD